MSGENVPIVIDNGSRSIKGGFAGEDFPSSAFRSIVGSPKEAGEGNKWKGKKKEHYIGEGAMIKEERLSLCCPIQKREIGNWEEMERIWDHLFHHELFVFTQDHPVLCTEAPLNPKWKREKAAQIMFETFHVPAFYLAIQPTLSLYASGRTTGMVLDSGEEDTHSCPIVEGYLFPHALCSLPLGGKDLAGYLGRLLAEKGMALEGMMGEELVYRIKEKVCYTTLDYDQELKASPGRLYTLPDGQILTLQDEPFKCPEPLFHPSLLGVDSPGLHELVDRSFWQCDLDIKPHMTGRIVLAGGNTRFKHLEKRIDKQLASLPNHPHRSTTQPASSNYCAWIGGSILTSLSSFQHMWVSLNEYNETGPSIIHHKCF